MARAWRPVPFQVLHGSAVDRSDAPWFADPSPEGQERDCQLRVVPEVELNAAQPRPEGPGAAELWSGVAPARMRGVRSAWVTDLPLNPA